MAIHGWAGGVHSMALQPCMYCLGGWGQGVLRQFLELSRTCKLHYSAGELELLSDFWALGAR